MIMDLDINTRNYLWDRLKSFAQCIIFTIILFVLMGIGAQIFDLSNNDCWLFITLAVINLGLYFIYKFTINLLHLIINRMKIIQGVVSEKETVDKADYANPSGYIPDPLIFYYLKIHDKNYRVSKTDFTEINEGDLIKFKVLYFSRSLLEYKKL